MEKTSAILVSASHDGSLLKSLDRYYRTPTNSNLREEEEIAIFGKKKFLLSIKLKKIIGLMNACFFVQRESNPEQASR